MKYFNYSMISNSYRKFEIETHIEKNMTMNFDVFKPQL